MPRHGNSARQHSTLLRHGHRSVSLEQDHASIASGRQFVLTSCASRAMRRIVEGLAAVSGSRAWTLTGPFGTGKSSFGLFLSRALACPEQPASGEARAHLAKADPSLHSALLTAVPRGKGLAAIVVTGSREPLSVALGRAMSAALESSKVSGANRLAKDIRQSSTDARHDPLKSLQRTISILTSDNATIGVSIVIDELGKLLEYAAVDPKRSDVYLLQRLAEFAARSEIPTLLIGILHQDFVGYAQELSENDRKEWEKVRGRFEDIIFEQSADDMLRLISEAMSRSGSSAAGHHSDFSTLCKSAWTHKLVPPGLHQVSGLSLLTNCYPLHPSATLLLGPLFKRFGQNERSAFSFLASGEPHALADFVRRAKSGELYSIEHLYEYLVGVFGDTLLVSRDGKRWAEAFNVEAQHPDLTSHELRLLRTIALLGIVGRWNGIAPTPAVLQFALTPAMTIAEYCGAIKTLQKRSAIVYRRFNDTYSLWEGSDIDVEARIADMRSQIAADVSTVQLLSAHYSPRPLLARRHSYETGTLRYFDVAFVTKSTLAETLARFDAADPGSKADGQVAVLLPECRDTTVEASKLVLEMLKERPDIVLCVPGNARELESLARELSSIERVQAATTDLQHDATARRELATRREDVHGRVQQAVAEILVPYQLDGPPARWYRSGTKVKLSTARALNEFLSAVCDEHYRDAPRINNEIINRRELSSSAAAAQGNLIKGMLEHGDSIGLGIEGNPPERSVYLSVLQELGLHALRDGRWAFATIDKHVREDARPVYSAIRTFFDESKDAPIGLDKLFTLLRRAPFGLRNGVIPILVCAALIGHDADIALYDEGAFVPQLTSAVFDQIIKSPARYTVRRWHVSGVRVAVFELIGRMLGQSPVIERVEVKDLLGVVKPLVRFVRKLNDFTRQTKALAPLTIAVRTAINEATEPDMLLFRDLPKACGVEPFAASKKDRSSDIETFLRRLQSALLELQRGYELLLQSLTADIAAAFDVALDDSNPRSILVKRAALVRAIALSPDMKVFTTRLLDPVPDESLWIEQLAAFLAHKHPNIWHDDDRARFSVRLSQVAEAFKALESLAHARQGLVGGDEDHESIRIAVVGNRSAQTEQVVHLNRREADEVSVLQAKIQSLFRPLAMKGSHKLAVAALAKVAQDLFVSSDTHHLPVLERKSR